MITFLQPEVLLASGIGTLALMLVAVNKVVEATIFCVLINLAVKCTQILIGTQK